MRNKEKTSFFDLRTEKILPYCPTGTISLVNSWLLERDFQLRISRERVSKLGDFRPAGLGKPARISINNNLNPVEFLITFAHELAHYDVYKRFRKRRKPHGDEWKHQFRNLLNEIIESKALDSDICDAIIRCYFLRERIASSPCIILRDVLSPENEDKPPVVQDIREGETFMLRNGKRFIMGERIRTRYRCKEISTGKLYTIHPLAVITKI